MAEKRDRERERRERLTDEINKTLNGMNDRQMIEFAWEEFADFEIGPESKAQLRDELLAFERELDEKVLMEKATRRRVRRAIGGMHQAKYLKQS
jgi:hypothetical protein